jgi:hypothetical protein
VAVTGVAETGQTHWPERVCPHTGKVTVIGSLSDIEAIVQGKAGTHIRTAKPGITYL